MNDASVSPVASNQREILTWLKDLHAAFLKNGETLEQKGWQMLTFGSSTLAVVAVFQALLVQDRAVSAWFWLGLIAVLLLYSGMVFAVFRVVRPLTYTYPLDLPGPEYTIEQWDAVYISTDSESVMRQLISRLAGDGQTSGVIQDAQALNEVKARYLDYAVVLLALTMIGLVGLAAIAVLS